MRAPETNQFLFCPCVSSCVFFVSFFFFPSRFDDDIVREIPTESDVLGQ